MDRQPFTDFLNLSVEFDSYRPETLDLPPQARYAVRHRHNRHYAYFLDERAQQTHPVTSRVLLAFDPATVVARRPAKGVIDADGYVSYYIDLPADAVCNVFAFTVGRGFTERSAVYRISPEAREAPNDEA